MNQEKARQVEKWCEQKNDEHKALVVGTKTDCEPTEMALTASHKTLIGSRATALMMQHASVISDEAVPSDISTGMAGRYLTKGTGPGQSATKLSDGEKPVTWNHVLYVPDVEHSLIFVSRFCDDNHTVNFTNRTCVTKKISRVAGVV